jgi:hypothetical protein
MALRFWVNFVYLGIVILLCSVVSTYYNYFFIKSQLLINIGIFLLLIGTFIIYFALWQGDKVDYGDGL